MPAHAFCMCAVVILFLPLASPSSTPLSALPPGVSLFARSKSTSTATRQHVSTAVASAIKRALANGVTLLEVDFPPLIGSKSQLDDFSNIEHLDANRDFAFELIPRLGLGAALNVCLLDEKECELAKLAYPGLLYISSSIVPLASAAKQCSGRAFGGSWLDGALAKIAPPKLQDTAAEAPLTALRLVVQPCEEGRVDDWLNMELLTEGPNGNVPIVCMNGYLDKQRTGYYPRWQFPEIARCGERFLSRFDPVYVLKPVQISGRVGWLLRVYPEPWQLHAQERDGSYLIETFAERPAFETIKALLASFTPPNPRR